MTEVLSASRMSTLSRVISWLVRLPASEGELWSSYAISRTGIFLPNPWTNTPPSLFTPSAHISSAACSGMDALASWPDPA